jgi:hypothetical protein
LLARLKDGGSGGPCLPPASQSAIFAWLALVALERIFAFGVLAFFPESSASPFLTREQVPISGLDHYVVRLVGQRFHAG